MKKYIYTTLLISSIACAEFTLPEPTLKNLLYATGVSMIIGGVLGEITMRYKIHPRAQEYYFYQLNNNYQNFIHKYQTALNGLQIPSSQDTIELAFLAQTFQTTQSALSVYTDFTILKKELLEFSEDFKNISLDNQDALNRMNQQLTNIQNVLENQLPALILKNLLSRLRDFYQPTTKKLESYEEITYFVRRIYYNATYEYDCCKTDLEYSKELLNKAFSFFNNKSFIITENIQDDFQYIQNYLTQLHISLVTHSEYAAQKLMKLANKQHIATLEAIKKIEDNLRYQPDIKVNVTKY